MMFLNKGNMEILFRELMCIDIGKHLKSGHNPEHIQLLRYITRYVPFKVITQEGKMEDIFLDSLVQGHGAHVQEWVKMMGMNWEYLICIGKMPDMSISEYAQSQDLGCNLLKVSYCGRLSPLYLSRETTNNPTDRVHPFL